MHTVRMQRSACDICFTELYLFFFMSTTNKIPQQWQPWVLYGESRGPMPSCNRGGPISKISFHLEMGWKRVWKITIFWRKNAVFRGGRLTLLAIFFQWVNINGFWFRRWQLGWPGVLLVYTTHQSIENWGRTVGGIKVHPFGNALTWGPMPGGVVKMCP